MAKPDAKSYLQKQDKAQLIRIILEHRAQLQRRIEQVNSEIGTTATGDQAFYMVIARGQLSTLQSQYEGLITGTAGQVANLDNDRDQ